MLIILTTWGRASAQHLPMQNGTFITCEGLFTDSGGPGGAYGPNESFSITLCPDGVEGTHTRLIFLGTDIRSGDLLCFFDGDDDQAPSLGCSSNFQPGSPFIVQASPGNPTGCLTVNFSSNASQQGPGWTATIGCVATCQAFHARIESTLPATMPADTGWIDLCPGEGVSLSAGADFFQNDILYHQDLAACTFEWDFGDGHLQYGINPSHIYRQPGGYRVQLTIIDSMGCQNTNFVTRRVRVAPPPRIDLGPLPGPLCLDDTLSLLASSQSSEPAQVYFLPREARFDLLKTRADTLPLPDGTGAIYQTRVTVTEFLPDAVLTDPNQILAICANMEHSWMRDLRISITCPSGKSIVLVNQEEAGEEVFLGVPFEDDELLPIPIPGTGYTYCWNHQASNPDWLTYANQFNPGTLPADTYQAFESMDNLIGCPLNGDWTMTIQDNWAIDNGYIFWWNIAFDEALAPAPETFTPQVNQLAWRDATNILDHQGRQILARADKAGASFFRVEYLDNFGCRADTFLTIPVRPPTHPDCLNCADLFTLTPDTAVCLGQIVALQANVQGFNGGAIPFASYPMVPLGYSTNPPSNPYQAAIEIQHIQPATLDNAAAQIESVCFSLQTQPVNNIAVWLEAPNGALLELTTYNGGAGSDYRNTCFRPGNFPPVTGGSAPFTGTYRPEGNWNVLNGAPANGTWKLLVSDNFGINRMGLLENWSITLQATNQFSYTWSPPVGLSCNQCPDPWLEATQSTAYTLNVSDLYGCSKTEGFDLTVFPAYPAPSLSCGESTASGLRVYWNAIPGAPAYEIRINGGSWMAPGGSLDHLITGLNNGDFVEIELRVMDPAGNCPAEIATLNCQYRFCNAALSLIDLENPVCPGDSNGTCTLSATGGLAPYRYSLNGQPFQDAPLFADLPAGGYVVILEDALNCRDTLQLTLNDPEGISLSLTVDTVSCNGGQDGRITAVASGGQGPWTYTWGTIPQQVGAMAEALSAGLVSLTVTDSKGCRLDTLLVVPERSALEVILEETAVSCPNGGDGRISAAVTGGLPPYQFLWPDGQTGAQAQQLMAGSYTLTVTDAAGCSISAGGALSTEPPSTYTALGQSPTCAGGSDGRAWLDLSMAARPVAHAWQDPAMQWSDTAVGLAAGTYAVYLVDARGCPDTLTINLTDPAPLVLTIAATDETCPGVADGQLAAQVISGGTPPYSFLWDDPANQTQSTAVNLAAGGYNLTVTDLLGCTATGTSQIEMADGLLLTLWATDARCPDSADGEAAVSVAGGKWPYFFQWNDPAQSTDSLATGLPPGQYQVTVTCSMGCTATASVSLGYSSSLAIMGFDPSMPSCYGTSGGSLEVRTAGGVQPLSFQWSVPGSSNPLNGIPAGTYSVTVSDADGCAISASATLNQPDPLEMTLHIQAVRCFNGADGSIRADVSGGTPPYGYVWNTNPPLDGPQAENLTAGQYAVTVTDSRGCTQSQTTTLNQPAQALEVLLIQTRQGCSGDTGNHLQAQTSGGTPPFSYTWSAPGAQGANLLQVAAGLYQITVTDASGCTAQAELMATDLEPVIVALAGSRPSCFGDSDGSVGVTQVSGGSAQGQMQQYQFTWSTTPAQQGPFIQQLSGGISYSVTATDPQGCSGSATYFLEQPLPILAQLVNEPVRCAGEANGLVRIEAISGGEAPYNLLWDSQTGNSTANQVVDLPAGLYQVTITDSRGCTLIQQTAITQPAPLTLSLLDESPPRCYQSEDGLLRVGALGGNGSYDYLWENGQPEAIRPALSAGTYQVTVTDLKGCSATGAWTLDEPSPLELLLSGEAPNCQDQTNGEVEAFPFGGTPPYQFALGQGPFQPSPLFSGLSAGTITIRLQDSRGCQASEVLTLADPDGFAIDLGPDITIQLGTSVTLGITHNAPGPVQVTWSAPGNAILSCVQCPETTVTPSYVTTYTATATDERGCRASGQVTVAVVAGRTVRIPTAFTPNGDGQNDRLLVHGTDQTRIEQWQIFDRWGELIYSEGDFWINDQERGWDGRFRGREMPSGVYIWVVELLYPDGFRQQITGRTTLIR